MSALDGFFHNLSDEENSDGVLEESVPSQATPVVSDQQHRTENFQPVMQFAQPCSFSATPSYPQNFSGLPNGASISTNVSTKSILSFPLRFAAVRVNDIPASADTNLSEEHRTKTRRLRYKSISN